MKTERHRKTWTHEYCQDSKCDYITVIESTAIYLLCHHIRQWNIYTIVNINPPNLIVRIILITSFAIGSLDIFGPFRPITMQPIPIFDVYASLLISQKKEKWVSLINYLSLKVTYYLIIISL